jgi:hypothetical protein
MKQFFSFLLFFLACYFSHSQNTRIFKLDSLPKVSEKSYSYSEVTIDKNWLYHKGDDSLWAKPEFDDSSWDTLNPILYLSKLPPQTFEKIGWFRVHLVVDTSLTNKTLALLVSQNGASEIYLNGKLIHTFGKIDIKNSDKEERYDPQFLPVDIRFEKRNNLLAVRYANATAIENCKKNPRFSAGFAIRIGRLTEAIESKYVSSLIITSIFIFYFTFFLALGFLHLMLFLFYRANKANLYYSIFAVAFGIDFLFLSVFQTIFYPDVLVALETPFALLSYIYMPALIAMLYSIFNKKILKIFWLWFAIAVTYSALIIFNVDTKYFGYVPFFLFALETFRIILNELEFARK